MEKYTQKELKSLVKNGVAVDVTNAQKRDVIPECYSQVGYASGVYGCNGLLLKGDKTGNLYAVIGRTTALFLF